MKKHISRTDFFQNLAIVLLTLSAVLLFARSQFYNLGISAGSHYLSRFTGSSSTITSPVSEQRRPISIPVRVVVTGAYGRYGGFPLSTSGQEFEPLGSLLSEVIGSSHTFSPCQEQDFLDALSTGFSVYYDFGSSLPLPILSGLLGLSMSEEQALSAQRVLVADHGQDYLCLYLWDGGSHWWKSRTVLSPNVLLETVNLYELGGVTFAMDLQEQAEDLPPLTLIPNHTEAPVFPMLSASSTVSAMDSLLSALNFNPRTNLRYLDADGAEVIIEGERSLRIGSDGTLNYQSGGESLLSIHSSHTQSPTPWEAVVGVDQLLNTIAGDETEGVSLALSGMHQNEEHISLEFCYAIDGVPILFTDGVPAAEVRLDGSVISSLELRYRRYHVSTAPSLLLPLQQALAISAQKKAGELWIGYADRGGEEVSAEWISQ